jgi:copper(I)-binding protein
MRFVMRHLAITAVVLSAVVPALTPAQSRSELHAHSGSARSSAQGEATVYFALENRGPGDRLLGASTTVADHAEIRQFVADEGGSRRQGVDAVEVPAASRRNFNGDCYFLVLRGLRRPLNAGETISVLLHFERGGTIELPVAIRSGGDRAGADLRSAQ